MLLDTSILVDVLRNRQEALEFFVNQTHPPNISVLTVMELRAGERGRRERQAIDRFIGQLHVLDVTLAIAERAGQFLRQFRKSHGVQAPDAIIAATADLHRLPLATLNLRHFPMFPGLQRPY